MKRDELMMLVQEQMPAKRWEHVLGVISTASELAKKFGADVQKADLAAILHDYAKYWPPEALEQIIRREGLPEQLLAFDHELWHAPVGAYIAEHELGISDLDVLNAVRYHTSGRKGMTLLEKVVCLADYIEPGRSYPGVENIRQLAQDDLNAALLAGFDATITYLLQKRKAIFPLTISARNDLIINLGGVT